MEFTHQLRDGTSVQVVGEYHPQDAQCEATFVIDHVVDGLGCFRTAWQLDDGQADEIIRAGIAHGTQEQQP